MENDCFCVISVKSCLTSLHPLTCSYTCSRNSHHAAQSLCAWKAGARFYARIKKTTTNDLLMCQWRREREREADRESRLIDQPSLVPGETQASEDEQRWALFHFSRLLEMFWRKLMQIRSEKCLCFLQILISVLTIMERVFLLQWLEWSWVFWCWWFWP